jgi:peptidyl-prolyl cis-trans isomerase C
VHDEHGEDIGMNRHVSKLPLVALVVAVVAAMVGGVAASADDSHVPDGAALVVGDDVVTVKELDQRIDALRALYGIVPPKTGKELERFRRDAAKSVAVSMILDRQEVRRGIRISDKQARDALDRYIVQQFGEGGRADFVRALGNVGTSERDVLDELKRQLAVQRLMKDVVGTVSISDAELAAEFERRKADLGIPERRTVQNIVVADEAGAQVALHRLEKGESIRAVAADVSIDESTKDKGGALGAVAREQLEPAVGRAVFGTPKGGYYGPVKGQFGWNVGTVTAIANPVPADFARDGAAFRAQLEAETRDDRWTSWLTDRIRAADVRYADDYRPAHPDAAPTESVPAS